MSQDQDGTVQALCLVSTFDDEVYQQGKRYAVSQQLLERYPDSFQPVSKEEPESGEKQAEPAREDPADKMQRQYEKARDYQALLDAQADEMRERERQTLAEEVRKQRAAEREAAAAGAESTGWQPKPPSKGERSSAKSKGKKSAAPNHTLPRAERLKEQP